VKKCFASADRSLVSNVIFSPIRVSLLSVVGITCCSGAGVWISGDGCVVCSMVSGFGWIRAGSVCVSVIGFSGLLGIGAVGCCGVVSIVVFSLFCLISLLFIAACSALHFSRWLPIRHRCCSVLSSGFVSLCSAHRLAGLCCGITCPSLFCSNNTIGSY
jgi:hypothetical protein